MFSNTMIILGAHSLFEQEQEMFSHLIIVLGAHILF